MEQTKKRSAVSWVIEFAGQKKPNYIFSILLAMCKVVFGLMPYLYMADIVRKLLEMHAGTLDKDMSPPDCKHHQNGNILPAVPYLPCNLDDTFSCCDL